MCYLRVNLKSKMLQLSKGLIKMTLKVSVPRYVPCRSVMTVFCSVGQQFSSVFYFYF